MKNIEVTNFKGNKYEGSWNEKTYSSNIADHPDLYRIYVNDQAIHITEKEYNRLIAGNLSEKMDRRRKEIETMSLYEKADILMTIFATGFGNKKDGLGDAFLVPLLVVVTSDLLQSSLTKILNAFHLILLNL